jgi:hypothetical protein
VVVGFACKVELLTMSSMDPQRLPFWHLSRHKHRDNRLWKREKKKAILYGLTSLCCPCNNAKDGLYVPYNILLRYIYY